MLAVIFISFLHQKKKTKDKVFLFTTSDLTFLQYHELCIAGWLTLANLISYYHVEYACYLPITDVKRHQACIFK